MTTRKITHHPLDIALGARIRLRRRELGLLQGELARQIGITFQQVQKYEHGANRVSFSRRVEIAHALDYSVHDLIEDIKDGCATRGEGEEGSSNALYESGIAILGALGLNRDDSDLITDYGMLGLDAIKRLRTALAKAEGKLP